MDKRWSVWLCPDSSDQPTVQQLVDNCCHKFESPTFNPHITLFGRVDADPDSTISFFENLIRGVEPIKLNVLGVKTGTPPWKALYLQMEKSESLTQLQTEIDQYLNCHRQYEFDPHLSLAYGHLEISNSEISGISFPESIRFSSVALVETPDEISSWKLLQRFNLERGII